jgi:hypothetical protein
MVKFPVEKLLDSKALFNKNVRKLIFNTEAQLENMHEGRLLVTTALFGANSIKDLLFDQKSLVSKATSGSNTDFARSLFHQQFANDALNIDRQASIINYKGFTLLDGSLDAAAKITTSASGSNSIPASSLLSFVNSAMSAGDTITIAGVKFTAQTTMTESTLDIDLCTNTPGGNVGAFREAIYRTLNFVPTGNGAIDKEVLAAKNTLSKFNFAFDITGHKITITAKNGGTINNNLTVGAVIADGWSDDMLFNGNNIVGKSVSFATGTAGVNGDLYSGTTIVRGFVLDTVLKSLNSTHDDDTGINVAGISNNPAFLGKIEGFKATYTQVGHVDLQIRVGEYIYLAKNVNTAPKNAQTVTFGSTESGGYFDLKFDSSNESGASQVTDQSEAEMFARRVDMALAGVDFFQKRMVSSYSGGGSIYPEGERYSNGNLAGSKFELISNDFSKLEIESIKVRPPSDGSYNAKITIRINGEDYVSGYDNTGAVLSGGFGSMISGRDKYGFVNVNDPRKIIAFTYTSYQCADISNETGAASFQKALEEGFGINPEAHLIFPYGDNEINNIEVQIPNLKTTDLYLDEQNSYQELDISTQAGAVIANDVLNNALNRVISVITELDSLSLTFKLAEASLKSSLQILKGEQSNYDCKCAGQTASEFFADVA